jgi:hypothetical protein
MKLGVSYNIFDGEELLKDSIKSIRENVDYINVVYQTTSNFGQMCSEKLLDILSEFQNNKFVDTLYFYEPDLNKGSWNETIKRTIGLRLAKKEKCTHFLTMDTDEFYDAKQFKKCKDIIEKESIDSSACKIYVYLKESIYRFKKLQKKTYCPFIHKINLFSVIKQSYNLPVLTDSTRRIGNFFTGTTLRKFKLFAEDEIVMHHFSLIRKDMYKKFLNTSHIGMRSNAQEKIKTFNRWKYPDLYEGYEVIEVENKFRVNCKSEDF